jgi:hypothetical protein
VIGLATGGGGCRCELATQNTPAPKTLGLIGLALTTLLFRRHRRGAASEASPRRGSARRAGGPEGSPRGGLRRERAGGNVTSPTTPPDVPGALDRHPSTDGGAR